MFAAAISSSLNHKSVYKHVHNCHNLLQIHYLLPLTLLLSTSGVKLLSLLLGLRLELRGLLFRGGLGDRDGDEEYRLRLTGGGEREPEGDLRRGGGGEGDLRLGGGDLESTLLRGGERESGDLGRRGGGGGERESDLARPLGGGLSSYLILPPLGGEGGASG